MKVRAGCGINNAVAVVLEKLVAAACVGAALTVIVLHALKIGVPIWLEKLVAATCVGAFISVMGYLVLKVGRIQRVGFEIVIFLFSYLVVHSVYVVNKR